MVRELWSSISGDVVMKPVHGYKWEREVEANPKGMI
jgi:hypothetical protein